MGVVSDTGASRKIDNFEKSAEETYSHRDFPPGTRWTYGQAKRPHNREKREEKMDRPAGKGVATDATNLIKISDMPHEASAEGEESPLDADGSPPPVISIEERRASHQAKARSDLRIQSVKEFADKLHDVMLEAVAKGLSSPEIATLMAQYIKKIVMCSFEGLHPSTKQQKRDELLQFLARQLHGKPALAAPSGQETRSPSQRPIAED